MPTLSIVIPAYNEGKTIHLILDRVKAVELTDGIKKEIIIVNDCSTDNTGEAIIRYKSQNPSLEIKYHRHEINKGKGAAIHTGIHEASGEYIIIQDADLEYDPQEYNLLLKPILQGSADVVYGSRFAGGEPHRILFFWHTIGNRFLTFLSNAFSNLNLSDMETCYKLFRGEVIRNIPLKENRFGFEPEVTQKIARIKGIRIYEVGISYYGRTYEEGKKIGWKDGFRAMYCIFKYGLFQRNTGQTDESKSKLAKWFTRNAKLLTVLLAALVFFSAGIHLTNRYYCESGYKNILTSDGLGYFQYLPAFFIHHDLAHAQKYAYTLPNGMLFNKYTCGVAYLQAPFYGIADCYLYLTGQKATGYTAVHGFFISLGALFYAFTGLLLLFYMLRKQFSTIVSWLVVISVFYATNLTYYTLAESAMSHVYSFFLIMLFIFKVPEFIKKPNFVNTILIGLPLAIAVLVRPTNAVIALYLLLFNVTSLSDFRNRIFFFFKNRKYMILILVISMLVFLPQMAYWHLTTGKWFVYSYQYSYKANESFIYWKNPKVFQVLFGSTSGWLIYSPVMILSMIGLVWMVIKKHVNTWAIIISFLLILYLNASWWCYSFDCGFGYRSLVEYYGLMAFPVAFVLQKIWTKRRYAAKALIIALIVFLGFSNIRMAMIYTWDPCWYGPDWTWKNYQKVWKTALSGETYKVSVHKL